MKRLAFEPPTDHYDKSIERMDEKICELIYRRKESSKNNPGFPKKELISAWSEKYQFYEDFLNSLFSHLLQEDLYRPMIEPQGFIKNVPILKSFENENVFYSVTFIRQYENASVVHFNMDKEESKECVRVYEEHTYFDLSIESEEEAYDCRNEGGGGSMGHLSYSFVVSPALPEDLSGVKLVFKEVQAQFRKPTGFEVII